MGTLTKLIKLDLSYGFANLTGTLPESFSALSDLREITIFHSSFTGSIFDKLTKLTNLERIVFGYTKFIDTIPSNISNLTKLKYLYIASNRFPGLPFGLIGEIPASIGALINLESLNLNENGLTGEMPATIGNLVQLKSISLSRNQLTGSIPAGLGTPANLSNINLSYNQLSGCIPSSLSSLCGRSVDIDYNLNLPSWSEFCATGANSLATVKDGNWHDATVWSCGKVPTLKDFVTIQHNVAIPASQAGQSRKISYGTGGRLNYGTGSNLRIGQ